ncbi:MAG: hypothetical protein JW809_06315 [Pirellulales bacterium]|nr:hypothetical protein [Pirellulales bacterium]
MNLLHFVMVVVSCLTTSSTATSSDAPPLPDDSIGEICAHFAGFDQNADGVKEIESLEPIAHAGQAGQRVLVLVEKRLLAPLADAPELRPLVERLAGDLAAEGYRADVIAVELAKSDRHQDGRYVLALREVLRAVRAKDDLAGAILVGRFPDALLVRTCNWRRDMDVTLREGQPHAKPYANKPVLRRVPEEVALRADIVLSDLDGRWEDVYVQPRTELEAVLAVFPDGIPAQSGRCADFARFSIAFEDCFHVADGRLDATELKDQPDGTVTAHIALDDAAGGRELADADRTRPNALARPDVLVSRIDARGVALRPRADIQGADGAGLLDAEGRPQAVRFASPQAVPDWRDAIWEPNPELERRLLAEYLDRNHAYRTGAAPVAWRPASYACDLGSGYPVVAGAAADWEPGDPAAADVAGRPTLVELANWLRYPAVLRTFRAHSDPEGSDVASVEIDKLDACLGGPAWSWTPQGDRLVPSLAAACGPGKVNWFFLHSLWANRAVAPGPAFYHHTGCNGISPPGAMNLPYDHPAYGRRQGAESMLLLANGLALVGRAKVFYDEPGGFVQVLAEGGTFGAAWARYHENESNSTWAQAGGDIGRKRAYFWSVLGDWTLRLKKAK